MDEEAKTVTFKIYRDCVPGFQVTYENKKDLYRTLQKKLKELKQPITRLYWSEYDCGIRNEIKNADDLLAAVQHCAAVRVYYRTTDDDEDYACSSSDADEQESGVKDDEKKGCRTRSSSPTCRRHRPRSEPFDPYAHPAYVHLPWNFTPWNVMMDPRFGAVPFLQVPRPSEKRHHRKQERSHHRYCMHVPKDISTL